MAPGWGWLSAGLAWLRELPVRRPWWVVAVVVATLFPSAWATSKLEVETSFSELLPDSKPSVIELERTKRRLAGTSTLIVAVEGRDQESVRRFLRELAPELRRLGPPVVGVDTGGEPLRRFVSEHKLLFASTPLLRELRDTVIERYDYEVGKRTGSELDIADPPPPIDAETLKAKLTKQPGATSEAFAWGDYVGEGGKLGAVVVRTSLAAGDPRAFDLQGRILERIAAVQPAKWDPTLRTHFTGNLVTSAEEHRAVTNDLAHVGAIGIAMILGIVFLFFLRVRALVVMLLTIGTGCVWTFALAWATVSQLNSATGFLVSIVAGNGINFGIVLMARYLEARLRDGQGAESSVRQALRSTAVATLSAALAASVAYGSLGLSDFRGFRDFGVIGASGMALCWIASYTLMPALLVIAERVSPLRQARSDWRNRLRALYGRPFAYLATHAPRAVLAAGVLAGVAALVTAVRYVNEDPFEYDLKNIRNDAPSPTSARAIARRTDPIVGRMGREGRALLAERDDQVPMIVAELERRRAAAPAGEKPFDRVVSIQDLLPKDQETKLALIAEMRDRLERSRRMGALSDRDWARIQAELPPRIEPLTTASLPNEIAWPFEEADGTRGRIVYLVPTAGESINDARYLARWADSFREIPLPNGEVVRGSGDPVIFADMLASVRAEAPRTLLGSSIATLLVMVFAFRGRPLMALAVGSVALGFCWLLAFFAATDVRINFLNFVALPVSVGVGADYAINLLKRWQLERGRQLGRVLVETGGAVVLCSLTTLLGYLALAFSINGAVRSFGIAAAVGELVMLIAAMLVVPSALCLLSRRRSPAGPALAHGSSSA